MAKHNETLGNVYNVIKANASENKPINTADILRILNKDPDTSCDRKTVGRALAALRQTYGMSDDGSWPDNYNRLYYKTTKRSSAPIYSDYYFVEMKDSQFEDYELFYLMEAVQFSPYIDKKFAEDIIARLKEQIPEAGDAFRYHERVNERPLTMNKDFLRYLGDINNAINENRMISFLDNRYGIDKKLHPVSPELLEVCPFRVVVSDGYYWLLCAARDSAAIRIYRVDRLTKVNVLDEIYEHNDARKMAVHNPEEFLAEHRYMHSGPVVDVTMLIDRSILDDVLESFGSRIRIDKAACDANRYTVHIRSGEKDIIDWVMRYSGYAVLVEPDYLRTEILSRANAITSCYRSYDEEDVRYFETIQKVTANRRSDLSLIDIDLNGRESYKELKGIKRLTMSRNWIRDFSFLRGFKELRDLSIRNNEIGDPGVISDLKKLRMLELEHTGIKDLEFLRGLDNITGLTLCEFSLEDIEALYSLPNLKRLMVNKPVARLIDRNRLKREYGDSLKLNVVDRSGMLALFERALPGDEPNRNMQREAEHMKGFVTKEIKDMSVRLDLCSEIYSGKSIGPGRNKLLYLVNSSCDKEERNLFFTDTEHYAGEEYVWFATYEGDNVFAVSIFKRDHGLKLVGMARRNTFAGNSGGDEGRELYEKSTYAWLAHIKHLIDNKTGWFEISGELERSFRNVCTKKDLIDPQVLSDNNVFRGVEIEIDDYHYTRKISGNKRTEIKIAYGHIEAD